VDGLASHAAVRPGADSSRPHLAVERVSKRFGRTIAVDGISFELKTGEFVTLLGDSGCGKTTLLRIVAGFAMPDAGRVLRSGADVTALAPSRRGMGFVFQSYALFPTKTVEHNVSFSLDIARKGRRDIAAKVRELAEMVEIAPLLQRFPHELSGGQQQRVALARALVAEPDLLLLDEPMSALDARIRARLRGELKTLIDRLGITTLYVTHDQEEALALSDRVAVMRQGRIEQLGTPAEVYHRPASRFVAEFIGTANLVEGVARADGVEAAGALWPARIPPGRTDGERVVGVFRCEHIALAASGGLPNGAPRGRVQSVSFLGAVERVSVVLTSGRIVLVDAPSAHQGGRVKPGQMVALVPDPDRAVILDADRPP
jgi:putative spermidine/putrescine transport system ATP-binding protein